MDKIWFNSLSFIALLMFLFAGESFWVSVEASSDTIKLSSKEFIRQDDDVTRLGGLPPDKGDIGVTS